MTSQTEVNAVTHNFMEAFQHFSTVAGDAGMHLAYSLAGLTLVISTIMMVLQQDELNKMFSKWLQTALLYGLFFTLIKFGGSWMPTILNSFMAIGAKSAGLGSLTPESVFNVGLTIANKMFTLTNTPDIHWYNFGVIFGGQICGFFVLIIYALITAEVVIVLVKSYALVAMGPIIFAMGNSDFTRAAVPNYIRKVIGMGIQLMILYVIVGVGIKLGDLWIAQFINSGYLDFLIAAILPMLGGLIILYLVMKNVPAFLAEISGAGGFRNYGDAAIAAAARGASALSSALNKGGGGAIKGVAGGMGSMHGMASGARSQMDQYKDKKSFANGSESNGNVFGRSASRLAGGLKGGYSGFGKGTNYAHGTINTVKKAVKETVTGNKDK